MASVTGNVGIWVLFHPDNILYFKTDACDNSLQELASFQIDIIFNDFITKVFHQEGPVSNGYFGTCSPVRTTLTLVRTTFGGKTKQLPNVWSNKRYFWPGAIKLSENIRESIQHDLINKPTQVWPQISTTLTFIKPEPTHLESIPVSPP